MLLSPRFFLLGLGVLMTIGAAIVVVEFRDTRELRSRYCEVTQDAPRLRASNVQQVELGESGTGPHEKLGAELSIRDRMRSKVKELRRQLALPVEEDIPTKPQPRPVDADRDTWKNVGQGTPAETIETVLSAIERTDVQALSSLISFDAAARVEAERLFALLPDDLRPQYDDPKSLVAVLMAVNTPIPYENMLVLEQTAPDPASGVLQLKVALARGPSQPQEVMFRLQHDAGEWRLLVPALIIDGYRHRVMGTTSLTGPDSR